MVNGNFEITEIRAEGIMPYQLTDIKIVRETLEARFGKERLAEVIKSKYESSFKNRGISYEEAEENILRWYYKMVYS